MSHYCNICCIHMKSKRNYDLHCKTARHKAREELHSNNTVEVKHVCTCGKIFTKQPNLSRHHKTCETYKNRNTKKEAEVEEEIEDDKESLKQELQKVEIKNKELQEEIDRLKAEKSVTNNNQNIGTQNNSFTIHVNAFGHENIDHITENRMLKYISHVYGSIPMLVKHIYCDPKHPENHTVKISNYRHPYIKIRNKNKKWENANKEQIKSNIITKSYYMLDTTYEGNKDKLSESIQRNFEQMQEKFNDGEPTMMKNLNHDVDMVLMNSPG